MNIDRYNNFIKESVHSIEFDEISEYLMELTDIGYSLETSNIFISASSNTSTKIKSKVAYPTLSIELKKKNPTQSKPYQWDGSVHYKQTDELDSLNTCIKRLKSAYPNSEIVWNIRGGEINIRIVDKPITTEGIFDWFEFDERLESYLSSSEFRNLLDTNYIKIETHTSSGGPWSDGRNLRLEFYSEYHYKNDRDLNRLIKEGGDQYRFKPVVDAIQSFMRGYEKHVNLSIDFEKKGTHNVTDKVGIFNKKKTIGSFNTYMLEVRIKY